MHLFLVGNLHASQDMIRRGFGEHECKVGHWLRGLKGTKPQWPTSRRDVSLPFLQDRVGKCCHAPLFPGLHAVAEPLSTCSVTILMSSCSIQFIPDNLPFKYRGLILLADPSKFRGCSSLSSPTSPLCSYSGALLSPDF